MAKKKYPRIHLVMDNCFAIKRWVEPKEWMNVCKELGYTCVQPSTDNELDPLFHSQDYLDEWFGEVDRLQKEMGMQIANFYTSYQTYRTTGFAHPDKRVRDMLTEKWFKPIIPRMKELGAKGLGFYVWAMSHNILQDKEEYEMAVQRVIDCLVDLNRFANENTPFQISIEQMYDPHLPPFTIEQTRRYLKEVTKKSGTPLYVTVDVGHAIGQRKFLRPDKSQICEAIEKNNDQIWLGTDHAYALFERAVQIKDSLERENLITEILEDIEEHGYLFSNPEDTDVYQWIEQVGCYSPIYHLQQTNGITSSHAPFTKETNREGIIDGEKVLRAIKKAYDTQQEEGMTEDIYLSFEVFAGNTETERGILQKLKESTEYWRQFIPRDGMRLDELID